MFWAFIIHKLARYVIYHICLCQLGILLGYNNRNYGLSKICMRNTDNGGFDTHANQAGTHARLLCNGSTTGDLPCRHSKTARLPANHCHQ